MIPIYAEIIEWRSFDVPSTDRPYGLIMEGTDVLDKRTRARLIEIARTMIGPDPIYGEEMVGRWTTTYSCKTWAFETEGARAAFVMASKGETNTL